MATWQHVLAEPPEEPRALELWLQHAAGFILIEDVRRCALEQVDPTLDSIARAAAIKGIDDALGGLMQIIDGVTGGLMSARHTISINFNVRLTSCEEQSRQIVLDLGQGDGMCMGYHGWLAGNFGEHPVVVPRKSSYT